MNWPNWEQLLTKLLPLQVYDTISYDMAEIFSLAAFHYPPARSTFEQMSQPQLRQFVTEHAAAARKYDPHESIHNIQTFISRLYTLLETLLVVIIFIGTFASVGLWVSYSRGVVDLLGSLSGILLSVTLSGSALLVIPAALTLLYFRLLAFNSFFIDILNEVLVIGVAETTTRDPQELVGYGLWNSSLNGGAALKLLAIFSVLWLLTALIPKKDPYGYIKHTVTKNIDVFVDADGFIDATKRTYSRNRARNTDEGKKE